MVACGTPSTDLGVKPYLFAPLPLRQDRSSVSSSCSPVRRSTDEEEGDVSGGEEDGEVKEVGAGKSQLSDTPATEQPREPASGPPPPALSDSRDATGSEAAALSKPLEAEKPPVLIVLSQGSVVKFRGSVTVNAANTGCLMGGGVDGAIVEAGGEELMAYRKELPVLDRKNTRCQTGDAKRTQGGRLPCRWCVHAVGPNYCLMGGLSKNLKEGDAKLRSAYLAAMKRSQEVEAQTIGFSLLSAGVFRGRRTLGEVLEIAVASIEEGAYPGLEEVHLVAFAPCEQDELATAARKVWARRRVEPITP